MKSNGILVKKEQLQSNYKLTFENKRGKLHLVLHQNEQTIFNTLKINVEYSFLAFKGKKNYYFLDPHSIRDIKTKLFYSAEKLTNQIKRFRLKNLTHENIDKTITKIWEFRNSDKLTKAINTVKLEWIKDETNIKRFLSKKDRKRQKQLSNLKTLFWY